MEHNSYLLPGKGFAMDPLEPGLMMDSLTIAEIYLLFIGAWMVVMDLVGRNPRARPLMSFGSLLLLAGFALRCGSRFTVAGLSLTSYSPLTLSEFEERWPLALIVFGVVAAGLMALAIARLVRCWRVESAQMKSQ